MASVNLGSEVPYAGERPSLVRYKVMGYLCTLSFLTYYDRFCIMRAQEQIQKDLSISTEQMGIVFGAFAAAYALFEIPGGWLGDRVGARITLTRIVVAWSLFTALTGSAVGFVSLLACRFLFGAGEAGAYPNMARIQSNWLPTRERARWGGILWLMARWGGAFAPLIFGTIVAGLGSESFRNAVYNITGLEAILHWAPWRMGFWASGLVGVVWCLTFYPWFRDKPRDKRGVNAAELALIESGRAAHADDGHKSAPGMWTALITSRSVWCIAMLYIFSSFAWSFFMSWMPLFLKRVHGVTFEKSEFMTALPLFCGGISCLIGGLLCDRLVRVTGRKRLIRALFPICGYTTAALAMIGVALADSVTEAAVLMCVAASANDFGQAANWASIVDIGGRFAGTATGFINMVGNVGTSIQPYIGAIIFKHFGFGALFVVYACAFLIAASMWLFINPTKTFYEGKLKLPQEEGSPAV